MRILLVPLFSLLCVNAFANEAKSKDQWIKEAQAAAAKSFTNYHAVCNGKVVVRTGASSYEEFSGSKADVAVFGLYSISEADRLNGKLWSGKMEAAMGKSSRSIYIEADGSRKVSEWKYGREAEFNLVFAGGRWQIVNDSIYSPDWSLTKNVSCSAAGL